MNSILRNLAASSALTLLGAGVAQASIITVTSSGGSEAVLNVVSTSDSSSMSLDLGAQIAAISTGGAGQHFTLPQSVLDFISGAGGLGGISYSVIAGQATSGNSAMQFLHTSDQDSLTNLANAVRGTWYSNFDTFTRLRLNANNAGDTDTSVNNAYGPFDSATAGNYLLAGTDDWGTGGATCPNGNACNLVDGTLTANLFLINYGTVATQFATGTAAAAGTAALDLGNSRLTIDIVPLPAGLWLAATAFGLTGLRVRRRRKA